MKLTSTEFDVSNSICKILLLFGVILLACNSAIAQVTSDGTTNTTAQIPTSPSTLVQATSWRRNAQGKIELVADKSSTQVQQTLTCAGFSR